MPVKKAQKRTIKKAARTAPMPRASSRSSGSDADRIVEALEAIESSLDQINSTLSYRLELIEDNINSLGGGTMYLDAAIRGEPRPEL